MMTAELRAELRERLDAHNRKVLKINTKPGKALKRQCGGVTFLGSRCSNTADLSGFCYAHREKP